MSDTLNKKEIIKQGVELFNKHFPKDKHTTLKEKIDISTKWESQLPYYAQIYSRLNNEGQKEMLRQLSAIGKLVDRMQTIRKEKQNG